MNLKHDGGQKEFLARLHLAGDPVTGPRTGEVVSVLRVVALTEPRSFARRPAPGGAEEIARAWCRGELDLDDLPSLGGGHP